MSKKERLAAANRNLWAPEERPTPAADLVEGIVIEGNRGQYKVQTATGMVTCTMRGKLRKQFEHPVSRNWHPSVQRMKIKARDPIAVGDRVRFLPTDMGQGIQGIIEEVVTPESGVGAFTRDDSRKGTVRSVAGLDQLIAVFAVRDPAPHLRLLDRFLVVAEAQGLGSIICLNKLDLGLDPHLTQRLEVYRALGYPVVLTSADAGAGLDELRALLSGHTSAFLGASGVGKSSLLNALEPGLSERVSAVSGSTHKGRHTTTGTRLVPLSDESGYIADTAGIRALALGGVAAGQLDWCFREFRPYLGQCRLPDCRHLHEPDCAVQAAVSSGRIDAERYHSYCALFEQGGNQRGTSWLDAVSNEDHRMDKLAYTAGD